MRQKESPAAAIARRPGKVSAPELKGFDQYRVAPPLYVWRVFGRRDRFRASGDWHSVGATRRVVGRSWPLLAFQINLTAPALHYHPSHLYD